MENLNSSAGGGSSPIPCWVIVGCHGKSSDPSAVADGIGNTAVICPTSTGWLLRISFLFAEPPASSVLYYDWPGGAPGKDDYFQPPKVIAAHGDCILIEMWVPEPRGKQQDYGDLSVPIDQFLYRTGATTGKQPPSIMLLPACYFTFGYERERGGARRMGEARRMETENTGIMAMLRRGEEDDEVLVAQLDMTSDETRHMADLCLFRLGKPEWELRQAVPVVHDEHSSKGLGKKLRSCWDTDAMVPIGDRFMCWVNYLVGSFLLWDMAEQTPKQLRLVQLPVEPPEGVRCIRGSNRHRMERSRNMGAAGSGAVRLVTIDPRCCCGGPGTSTCARSRSAFTVTTWTLDLLGQTMAWVKDGVLDCEELWALPSYEGLPRAYLEYPVVSLDNPDDVHADMKEWFLEVDTRRKALLSSIRTEDSPRYNNRLPVKLAKW